MSTTQKQVYSRKINPETGVSEVIKTDKEPTVPVQAPSNLKEMREQLENSKEPITINNQDASAVVNDPPKQVEETGLKKEINDMMAEISQAKFKNMTDAFKEDYILLEHVNPKTNKAEPKRIPYVPMTMGMAKKVNKVGKQIRLFKKDLLGENNDGKMTLDIDGLRKKYPDILEDNDLDQEDIMDPVMQGEIVMNYIIRKKVEIYWGINDTDPYVPSDLVIMIGLFESRNNFSPS